MKIIFQGQNFIVIDKPAGLVIHSGVGIYPVKSPTQGRGAQGAQFNRAGEKTLVDFLVEKFPEIKNVGDAPEIRPGIVHRLDKETSGIMVVARNQKTFLELTNKFKKREIKKTYWAIVFGNLGEAESFGIIDKPIARSADYKKQVIAGRKTKTKIREAVTEYKIIKKFADYSLVEVSPRTGRMHQIRVHLNSIGHPIVGDEIYKAKGFLEVAEIKRQLLHAKELSFSAFGKEYGFKADIPKDMRNFLDSLTNVGNKDRI